MFVSRIVKSDAEFNELKQKMDAAGYKWVCLSNSGLPAGQARATFVPSEIDISRKADQ